MGYFQSKTGMANHGNEFEMSSKAFDKILVSDFDGTMTRHDFFTCAVKNLLSPKDFEPWDAYTRQEITHFEALQRIFQRIRASMPEMERVLAAMELDPCAEIAVRRLHESGWGVTVVSNGCQWYIDRFFRQHNLHLELHTNPGEYSPELGLQMRLPTKSPFFSPQFGISKSSVVRHAQRTYSTVAFAGDGRPDLEPALMVQPEHRFARQWLASELTSRGESFQEFSTWSEISERLTEAGS